MVYKKDQGRNARMFAFWSLFGLLAYGCLGEMPIFLRRMFAPEPTGDVNAEPTTSWLTTAWVEDLPLIGTLDVPIVLAVVALEAVGFFLNRILRKTRFVDLLIDTESELKKVTWPSAQSRHWINGTIAVVVTVTVVMLRLPLGVRLRCSELVILNSLLSMRSGLRLKA